MDAAVAPHLDEAATHPDAEPAPAGATARAEAPPVDADARTAAVLIALLAATIPLALAYVPWSVPGAIDDWNQRITTAPFDVVLLVILGWTLLRFELLADLFRSTAVRVVGALFAVSFTVSLIVNFSWLGVAVGFHLVTGLAVIATMSRAWRDPSARRLVLGAITAVGAFQAVLAMAQSAHGIAFGVAPMDFQGRLYPFGTSRAGRGGLTHPYHLAAVLAVAQGAALLGLRHTHSSRGAHAPWLLALALMGGGIAVTYTRSGAIGQVLLVICLLCGRADRRRLLPAALCIVVGLGIGGVAFGDGWLAKGEQTSGQDQTTTIGSSRSQRLREAEELFDSSPVTGVGPGRYVEALARTERAEYLPAHDLVAHEAAELGVLGGIASFALLALLGFRVLRGGAWTGAVVLPMIPFLLLDAYPYVFATGLATSALWLGLARVSLEPVDAGRTDAALAIDPVAS